MKKLLILSLILMTITSCTVLLSKMYGVDEIESFDADRHDTFVAKIREQISCEAIVSDTNQYKQVIKLGVDAKMCDVFGQPVQIIYFEGDKTKSYHVNCYAKGRLNNLDWNTDNRFASFLPESAVDISTILVGLSDYKKIYPIIKNDTTKKYTVFVFWTFLLEKVSRSAIKIVTDNLVAYNKVDEADVYLINTDKFFSK